MQFKLKIDSLSHGRAGVGRNDGMVVFTERTAPGDLALVETTAEHGSYLEAKLVELLEPGSDRSETPCPIVDRCGGCPWQQVSSTAQLDAKRVAVTELIRRVGKIEGVEVSPTVPSPRAYGYRNRIKLRFDEGKLGFYSAQTHRLVPVEDCAIAEERVRLVLPEVEQFVRKLATRTTRIEIASRGLLPGIALSINSAGRLRKSDNAVCKAIIEKEESSISGIHMWGRGWVRRWGDGSRRLRVDEAGTEIDPDVSCFGQVNTDANKLLVAHVVQETGPGNVLELFAGVGNFALPLARNGANVTAVETHSTAIECGQASASRQKIRHVKFLRADARTYLARFSEGTGGTIPDTIVMDPPRSGLGSSTEQIARIGAKRLVYVSCNPATLARDLRGFAERGYQLTKVAPFDLFPQTFHVETVCSLELT